MSLPPIAALMIYKTSLFNKRGDATNNIATNSINPTTEAATTQFPNADGVTATFERRIMLYIRKRI